MNVHCICKKYFESYSILQKASSSKKERNSARCCIASYLFILPPIIVGIGYGIAKLYLFFSLKNRVSILPEKSSTDEKPAEQFSKIVLKTTPNEQQIPLEQSTQSAAVINYPEVSYPLEAGFFVQVLNHHGYSIDGRNISFPSAEKAKKFTPNGKTFQESLDFLKKDHKISKSTKIEVKNLSTEQAINESKAFPIALNFANQYHAGGGPGFCLDPSTGLFVYDAPSAIAQEESLCQRTDLMASLTQLPHKLIRDVGHVEFQRSYYTNIFDPTKEAYISLNTLYAVQSDNKNFYSSLYLDNPKTVLFITSAASCYGHGNVHVNCSQESDAYQDAKQRIQVHLLAAAHSAKEVKQLHPDQPVELILGAFGCGAFAPKQNPDEYRKTIASIYNELLSSFSGFFDIITFAVPTFDKTDPTDAALANYKIFQEIIKISN